MRTSCMALPQTVAMPLLLCVSVGQVVPTAKDADIIPLGR